MRPIATDVARSVRISVCTLVTRMQKRLNRSRCRLGTADSRWCKKPCIRCSSRSSTGRSNLGGWSAHWKADLIISAAVYAAKWITQSSIATAATDFNASDWSMPYYIVPMKNPPLRCGLLPLVGIIIILYRQVCKSELLKTRS